MTMLVASQPPSVPQHRSLFTRVDTDYVMYTHKTKWLLAIMCLEDQRPKQAYCDSDRFQVSPLVRQKSSESIANLRSVVILQHS